MMKKGKQYCSINAVLFRRVLIGSLLVGLVVVAWISVVGIEGSPSGEPAKFPRIVYFITLLAGVLMVITSLWVWTVRFKSKWSLFSALLVTVIFLALTGWGIRKVNRWKATIWLWDYLCEAPVAFDDDQPVDVCFLFIDHFEPGGIWNSREVFPAERRLSRVHQWEISYRKAIEGHFDSDGRSPQHTWFFPVGHSLPEVISAISQWPGYGWGEIEYHLHHKANFHEEQIRDQIIKDIEQLRSIGAVTSGYGFVHGVYALAAGDLRYCRANNELDVLTETGCYADFTFPNIGTPAQPSQVNSIYYTVSTGNPKPYDRGLPAQVGIHRKGLLMIQGPMWAGLAWMVLDDANLSVEQPPESRRIERWLSGHVHVKGKPNWVFISVHSHSATEYAQEMLFDGALQETWQALEDKCEKKNWRLHYVTAREAYNIIKAAEAGLNGNPNDYRDFEIPPPENRKLHKTFLSKFQDVIASLPDLSAGAKLFSDERGKLTPATLKN
jgi:hypothetical protein